MILPWGIGPFIHFTIGFDYGFAKVHSIGADYVFNLSIYKQYEYDTITQSESISASSLGINNALFINYRYYLDLHKYRERWGNVPYLGIYYRYSLTNEKFGADYITDELKHYETNNSIGFLFGILLNISSKSYNGLDVNLGVHQNFREDEILYKQSTVPEINSLSYTSVFIKFNLYFAFDRNKKD